MGRSQLQPLFETTEVLELEKFLNSMEWMWVRRARTHSKRPFKPTTSQEMLRMTELFVKEEGLNGKVKLKKAENAMNTFLFQEFGGACEELGIASPLVQVGDEGFTLSKKSFKRLDKLHGSLGGKKFGTALLRSQAPAAAPAGAPKLGWFWESLPALSNYKVKVRWHRAFVEQLEDSLAFDKIYFPKNIRLLSHYLKMHLRHRLAENHSDPDSSYIAWFGLRSPEKVPLAFLWNTGLRLRSDRRQQVLVLCTPQKNPDYKHQCPWFCFRVVRSGEIGDERVMQVHIRAALQDRITLATLFGGPP